MKLVLAVLCMVALCHSAPQNVNYPYPVITRYDHDVDDQGTYNLNVQTSDGFSHQSRTELLNQGSENEELAVSGQYSYIGPDGVTYTVIYTADSNGFQAQGDHIPTSKKLGIPSAALASLAG